MRCSDKRHWEASARGGRHGVCTGGSPDRRTAAGPRVRAGRSGAAHPRAGPRPAVRPVPPGEDGCAGHPGAVCPRALWRCRDGLHQPGAGLRRAGVRGHLAARHHVGAPGAEQPERARVGDRGTAAAISRPAGAREKIAAYGLTEPAAGSDAVGIQATAVRDGRHYVLNGEKTWMSLADVADHFLVFAWTDAVKQKQRDHGGLSAFLVTREMKGVATSTIHGKLGIRAGNTGSIVMEDVRVPDDHRLGQEGEGFRIAMFALDQGRYTVAAGATGLIRACLDSSARYARERRTFGRPIGEHQLVKEMIAGMTRDYEVSRLLYLRAGWMKNQGMRNTRETSLAKWYATVASEQAAGDAVEIHGAYGYSDEYPVERFYRNAKGAVIYEGTREIHTLLQADYALGYREDKPTRITLPKWPFD